MPDNPTESQMMLGNQYEHLGRMLPEVYRIVNPVVMQVCEMYDVPSNPQCYPYPTRPAVNQMAEYIINIVKPQIVIEKGYERQFFWGPRAILGDLVLILLLSQLLRRRGTFWF